MVECSVGAKTIHASAEKLKIPRRAEMAATMAPARVVHHLKAEAMMTRIKARILMKSPLWTREVDHKSYRLLQVGIMCWPWTRKATSTLGAQTWEANAVFLKKTRWLSGLGLCQVTCSSMRYVRFMPVKRTVLLWRSKEKSSVGATTSTICSVLTSKLMTVARSSSSSHRNSNCTRSAQSSSVIQTTKRIRSSTQTRILSRRRLRSRMVTLGRSPCTKATPIWN